MRILHTADWHVGKTLRGRSRADEHRQVLAEIAGIARGRDVELILIAGDVFDSAAPGPESEDIVYRALLDLATVRAPIVVVAGNHDNAARLEAVRPLLALTDVHVASRVVAPRDGGVLRLTTGSGETAIVALMPFLSQRAIVRADALMSGDAADHTADYADKTRRIVDALCTGFDEDAVKLLLGHMTVVGGRLGGGERSAHTVEAYHVPAAAFPATMHYVALGHLHREQSIPAACPVRYSGSPLQLDFGETDDVKSVTLIEATPGLPVQIERVELESGRRLRTVRGKLDELETLAATVGNAYLRVEVDEPPRAGLADRVRELLPGAIEVRVTNHVTDHAPVRPSLAGGAPQELFAEYLAARGERDERLTQLFAELLEHVDASA